MTILDYTTTLASDATSEPPNDDIAAKILVERHVRELIDGLIGAAIYLEDGRHRRCRDQRVVDSVESTIWFLMNMLWTEV
jgi:hypothetical protein